MNQQQLLQPQPSVIRQQSTATFTSTDEPVASAESVVVASVEQNQRLTVRGICQMCLFPHTQLPSIQLPFMFEQLGMRLVC